MVRKSDGGYGYDTTDLATIRYRIRDLKADRILYVVDARQAQHFQLIFEAARRAGWLTDDVEAIHVPFGTVLGPDGRPFKTRAGGTVRLMDLLDDAVDRAPAVVAEKNPDLPRTTSCDRIAEQAGIGAVKYADLSTSRHQGLRLRPRPDGVAHRQHRRLPAVRPRPDPLDPAQGRRRRAAEVDPELPLHPAERALALALDGFADALARGRRDPRTPPAVRLPVRPGEGLHRLLRGLPGAPAAADRANRLALCRLTARTLRQGLDLLGIAAPERM